MATVLGREALKKLGLPAADSVQRLDRYARDTFAQVPSETPPEQDPLEILQQSVLVLDQWRSIAGIAEAAELAGIHTFGEVVARIEDLLVSARSLTGIDPVAAFMSDPAFRDGLSRARPQPDAGDPFPLLPTPSFVRAVSSLLEFCPINELETIGRYLGQHELGHRCRLSYNWIRAFVRRHTPGAAETFHILGRAYAESRLTLDETAHLLCMPRPDAVAWLEEHGYARKLDGIVLDPDQRAHLYGRMRTERLARGGEPVIEPNLVARSVIASQRIEDVDARRWLQPGA